MTLSKRSMTSIVPRTPDPTIEEIEAEILKAKFIQNPAEQYLSDRAKRRMREADIAQSKDERVKAAFLAGYKLARSEHPGPWKGFFFGALLTFGVISILFGMALGANL